MSIELENVSYIYSMGTPFQRQALKDVNLTINKGEIVAIIGHTGSGKSTLVQHLNGLLKPRTGKASIDGIDISIKKPEAKAARQQVGMVFQYPEHQLFAETVFEDIAFGPRNKGFTPEEVEKAVRAGMKFVNLDYDTYVQRSPFALSGGQMRRVAIAGVVAMNPDYLVLDEPSSGLDPINRNNVFKQLLELHRERGIALVVVTHSMEEAAKYADRMLVVNDTELVYDGKPIDIFKEHGERLKELGLGLPNVFALAAKLRAKGMKLPENINDEASLLKAIKKAKGWK